MKQNNLFLLSILLLTSTKAFGFIRPSIKRAIHLQLSETKNDQSDPCWGTMLDDDCSMGNIYAANFVASKWIKSMPCGEGIEVSFHVVPLADPFPRKFSYISRLVYFSLSPLPHCKHFFANFILNTLGLRHASGIKLTRNTIGSWYWECWCNAIFGLTTCTWYQWERKLQSTITVK